MYNYFKNLIAALLGVGEYGGSTKKDPYCLALEEAHKDFILESSYNILHLHIREGELKVMILDHARQILEVTEGQNSFKFGDVTVGLVDGYFAIMSNNN